MPKDSKVVTAFTGRIDELEKDTGYKYRLEYPRFKEALTNNRLYADWFEPGTILATARCGDKVVMFQVIGELHAELFNPDGEQIRVFDGQLEHIDPCEDGFKMLSDKDLEALVSQAGLNGYRLRVDRGNKIYVLIDGDSATAPLISNNPSVARTILNKDVVAEVLKAAEERIKAEIPDPVAEDIQSKKAFGEMPDDIINMDVDEDFLLPEIMDEPKPTPPFDPGIPCADDSEVSFDDLPEPEDEPAPVEEEKKPAKASKKKAKDAKQAAKAEEEKKPKAAPKERKTPEHLEEPGGRFDLLPLDIIGEIIGSFDEAKPGLNFFKAIEDFKNGNGRLLDAAVRFAKESYPDETEAVMKLAVMAEADAVENGEDAWKEKPVKHFINEAVKHYLLFLREGNDVVDHDVSVLWALICGVWVSENK